MRNLPTVEFRTKAPRSVPARFQIDTARAILASKQAMRETLPAGLVYDPAVEILLSLYVAGTTGLSTATAAAASGVTSSVASRWISVLDQQGLLSVREDDGGKWAMLSDKGFACATRAIDAVIDRRAALLA